MKTICLSATALAATALVAPSAEARPWGVHMIDGKMQDDATWKQCKVMVTLAEMLAKKDPELAEAYDL
jgi:citrate lyase beta subunit